MMKTKVWEALIGKEENRASVANRQLDTIQKQYQHLRDRMAYIEGLVSEYSDSAAGSPMQRSTYQLQLFGMREKLGVEAQLLSEKIREIRQTIAAHHGEIRKFDKMRVLTEERQLAHEHQAERRRDDESGTLQFNFQRRGF
jgi:hypothetical protein